MGEQGAGPRAQVGKREVRLCQSAVKEKMKRVLRKRWKKPPRDIGLSRKDNTEHQRWGRDGDEPGDPDSVVGPVPAASEPGGGIVIRHAVDQRLEGGCWCRLLRRIDVEGVVILTCCTW